MKKNFKLRKTRKLRRSTGRRILRPAGVYNVSPLRIYSPIPQQMRLRLRGEYDRVIDVAAQQYSFAGQSAMSMQLPNIGNDQPPGTAVCYPAGLRALHVLYQRSVVEKATVIWQFTSASQTPAYISCGILTNTDATLAAVNPDAITFNNFRNRSDFKSYILQSEGGSSLVTHYQTIDIDKLYPNLTKQDAFTHFSDRTGQIHFPVNAGDIPYFVCMFSPAQAEPLQVVVKVTIEYHVRFFDLHLLQARNNIATA